MSNTLSFARIQDGLAKVGNLGILSESFEVEGTQFTVRTLRAREHKAVNGYIAHHMNQYEGEDTSAALEATIDFFMVRKIEALAYAIQQIGDLNFNGIEFVETGETDENGNAVKQEKHVFLRRLLADMDPSVIDVVHRKYADLLVKSEEKAADQVEFRDLEEELERVELRREEILRELGREDEINPEAEAPVAEDAPEMVSQDQLNELFRKPVSEEEAQERLQQMHEQGEIADREAQPEAETPEQMSTEDLDELDVGGQKFIRLDDPDTPYSDEEQKWLEEQERLYQQKFGEDSPEVEQFRNQQREDAQARLQQKRQGSRKREPLNRVPPRVEEGSLPESAQNRPTIVRKSQIDTSDLPLAEGLVDEEPEHLGRTKTQGSGDKPINAPAQGNDNPNFKGH